MDNTIKCPYCGGEIKENAKKCRHCGKWLEPQQEVAKNNQAEDVAQHNEQQPVSQKRKGLSVLCNKLGLLFVLFGVLDFCLGNFAEIDLTGSRYSPIIAGVIASGLYSLAKKLNPEDSEE